MNVVPFITVKAVEYILNYKSKSASGTCVNAENMQYVCR